MATELVSHLDKEKSVKKLKRDLESWRVIIVHSHSVLLWEQSWYPEALVAVSTIVFFALWMIEPSFITTISFICLILTLLDYLVPTVTSRLCLEDSWTGAKEKKFEDVCRVLIETKIHACQLWSRFNQLKQNKPKVYICSVLVTLCFLAWIGTAVSNLFLTYLIISYILLHPGLKHHGILEKYSNLVLLKVYNLLISLQGKKPKSKLK